MLGSDLQICTISADKLKKKLWENPEQVKILWSKQINLATIKLMNSTLSEEYRDFIKLFADETSEKTFSTSILRSQNTHCRRQDVREDINLSAVIREVKSALYISW